MTAILRPWLKSEVPRARAGSLTDAAANPQWPPPLIAERRDDFPLRTRHVLAVSRGEVGPAWGGTLEPHSDAQIVCRDSVEFGDEQRAVDGLDDEARGRDRHIHDGACR